MRREEEFYCTNCSKYFLTYLRDNMSGKYTIECPACKHHHFRVIDKGLITEDRHDSVKHGDQSTYQRKEVELIMGLKSTLRTTPYHNDPDWKRKNQMFAVK